MQEQPVSESKVTDETMAWLTATPITSETSLALSSLRVVTLRTAQLSDLRTSPRPSQERGKCLCVRGWLTN